MSVTEALLNLDQSLEPTLLGVLAALSVVASTVVWQSQRNRGATKMFAIAATLFLAALLVDVAVFPMLQEFVTRTTDTDLLGNFTTTLFDTASQYVFLLLGGGTLLAGALSLIRAPATGQEPEEPGVRTPTEDPAGDAAGRSRRQGAGHVSIRPPDRRRSGSEGVPARPDGR